jgi:hypothetical protein
MVTGNSKRLYLMDKGRISIDSFKKIANTTQKRIFAMSFVRTCY